MGAETGMIELSLGPAPTTWSAKESFDFYREVVRRPAIRRVYVGEMVCTKRKLLSADLVARIRELTRAAGVSLVLSTPPVVVTDQELECVAELASAVDAIEANNVGVASLARERFPDKGLVLGPYLNVYNEHTARFWRRLGARRLVLPVDVEWSAIDGLAAEFPNAAEMILFGRPALAFSWRCYTARAGHRLGRDCHADCRARRQVDLRTIDGEPLLVADGRAVYPSRVYCAVDSVGQARERGVSAVRIEPACGGKDAALSMIDRLLAAIQQGKAPVDAASLDTEYMVSPGRRQCLLLGG